MKTLLPLLALSAATLSADYQASLNQARTAINRGDLVDAEQILTAAIREGEKLKTRSAVDYPLEMLAQVFQREKKYPEAAAAHQRRIDNWTRMVGKNAVVVGRVLAQLAVVERQAGNLADAEAHSRRALAIMTAAYHDNAPAAQAAVDLADILLAQDRTADAEQMLSMAQKTFEAIAGDQSPLTTGVAARRMPLLRQLGRAAEAEQLIALSPSVYRIGKDIATPQVLSKGEPQYSEEARKKKLQGSILVNMVVDTTGVPTQIVVIRPLGMGLDQLAASTIAKWRFTPATKNGTPVPIQSQIEVTFHLL